MAQDLQSFIEFLEKHHPDEVLRIKREVDPVYEATAILWRLERERRFPLVIFENIKGSEIPCVTNVHASFPRLAMAIGLERTATPRDFVLEYMRREDNPIPPKLVDSGPVKDVVITGDDVDITKLPMLKYHELDSGQVDPGFEELQGRYITLGYDTMRDPDTGIANVGIYRLQAKSRNKFGIQISETAHGHYIMQKNLKHGRPTPMAVFNGVHRRRVILSGSPPDLIDPPSGCRFHTRCPIAVDRCATDPPPFEDKARDHPAACWLA